MTGGSQPHLTLTDAFNAAAAIIGLGLTGAAMLVVAMAASRMLARLFPARGEITTEKE